MSIHITSSRMNPSIAVQELSGQDTLPEVPKPILSLTDMQQKSIHADFASPQEEPTLPTETIQVPSQPEKWSKQVLIDHIKKQAIKRHTSQIKNTAAPYMPWTQLIDSETQGDRDDNN